MNMNKFVDICMLAIWICQLVYGIVSAINGVDVNAGVFICAVIVCICYFLDKIFYTEK